MSKDVEMEEAIFNELFNDAKKVCESLPESDDKEYCNLALETMNREVMRARSCDIRGALDSAQGYGFASFYNASPKSSLGEKGYVLDSASRAAHRLAVELLKENCGCRD